MRVAAMMIFGSVARGDSDNKSDTDILIVTKSGIPKVSKNDLVEIQYLSNDTLLDMARKGDLFAIHLAMEGHVVFDHDAFFKTFRESLLIRKSYDHEQKEASDFGWYLKSYGEKFNNQHLVNKRIAWCVRTILISKLIERNKFIFSPSGLKNEHSSTDTAYLIDLRRSEIKSKKRFSVLKKFLIEHGIQKPTAQSEHEFENHFSLNKFSIALSTIALLNGKKQNVPPYC